MTWAEAILRSSVMSWPTLGREDGDMLQRIIIIIVIDFDSDWLEDDDFDDDDDDDDDNDLTQENANLRKSGGHSGQSAEKALYSTPKFWNISHDDDDDDED